MSDRKQGKNSNFSFSRRMHSEGKISEEFEIMLNSLTLEELICLKLENASKVMKGKLFGFPIAGAINSIVRDAMVNFALSATRNTNEAASLLGVTVQELKKYDAYSILDKE